ncbi:hypothetical protein [uncultured Ruminococcus sp.]|uniref:hypothetical protein n=1 Tax=uncultured Ruminococcus sp. TaxID=165186 RepID=UPI0025DE477E|nr:hypothetical protein [uncultured Ruminococcus sp.]
MKLKNAVEKITDTFHGRKSFNLKKISTSYISIFLILLLLLSTTLAWFTINDTAYVDSDTFTMESVSGLRVNDGEDLKNEIKIENMILSEASSVDGRNMFFPTTGTFTSNTSEMTFREGNAGDKNVNYCYKDFVLKGDSGVTYVYIKSYSVTVDRKKADGTTVKEVFDGSTKITYDPNGVPIDQEKHAECPVRMSFIDDSANEPIVLDPSALINSYVNKYNAIDSIDENGKATTKESNAESFSDYYFGTGQPIFTLVGQKPLNVAMVVWLEGTSDACDQYVGQNISVNIELESNWSEMEYVYFVDDTIPDSGKPNDPYKWINKDKDCFVVMTYTDINAENARKSVVMKQSYNNQYEWYAPIPKNIITDISFYRYNLNKEEIYNAWHTFKGVDNQLSPQASDWATQILGANKLQEYRTNDGTASGKIETVYTARRGNGYGSTPVTKERLSPCIGYWGTLGSTETTVATQATTIGGSTVATQATTSPSGQTVTIQISLGTIKPWVQNNITNDGYELYAEFNDGNLVKMNKVSDDYYQNTSVKAKLNSILKCFTLKSASDTKYLVLNSPQLISRQENMSFEMQNDDTVKRTG